VNVTVVLPKLGAQTYRVEKGERIAQLTIEKINKSKLQGLTRLDDTKRGHPGWGSSNTIMDQEVKSQSAKSAIEINAITATAFGQFYRRRETTGILRWDEMEDQVQLEAIKISTKLVIKNKKNNEDQAIRDRVPQEYHHLLSVFEKGEKTKVPPDRPGIDLRIDLEEAKTVPIKTIYAMSYNQWEELRQYIKQKEN